MKLATPKSIHELDWLCFLREIHRKFRETTVLQTEAALHPIVEDSEDGVRPIGIAVSHRRGELELHFVHSPRGNVRVKTRQRFHIPK
jgi:hypothetical protein